MKDRRPKTTTILVLYVREDGTIVPACIERPDATILAGVHRAARTCQ